MCYANGLIIGSLWCARRKTRGISVFRRPVRRDGSPTACSKRHASTATSLHLKPLSLRLPIVVSTPCPCSPRVVVENCSRSAAFARNIVRIMYCYTGCGRARNWLEGYGRIYDERYIELRGERFVLYESGSKIPFFENYIFRMAAVGISIHQCNLSRTEPTDEHDRVIGLSYYTGKPLLVVYFEFHGLLVVIVAGTGVPRTWRFRRARVLRRNSKVGRIGSQKVTDHNNFTGPNQDISTSGPHVSYDNQ